MGLASISPGNRRCLPSSFACGEISREKIDGVLAPGKNGPPGIAVARRGGRLYRGRALNQTARSLAKTSVDVRMPAGIGNAYAFQVFNTVSFSIVLGTPMILYFKHLEASATVLGIVAALPNLLNILQIPAAQFVEQVGYRAFVLRGWSVRSLVL